MKKNNSMIRRGLMVLSALLILGLFSCVKDVADPATDYRTAPLSIATRSVNDGATNYDERVEKLRIMVFKGSTPASAVVLNAAHSMALADDHIVQKVGTGTYTIVFVGNETDASVGSLAGVKKLADLDGVSFASSAIGSTTSIPMYKRYDGVVISVDPFTQAASVSGSGIVFNDNKWKITLERLAIKLDLHLHANEDMTAKFVKLTIGNLPDKIMLVPTVAYAGGGVESREILAADFTQKYATHVANDTTTGWHAACKVRVVLPYKNFAPITEKDNAVTIEADLGADTPAPKGVLGHTLPDTDYTLHYNSEYNVAAELVFPIKLNVAVKPWTPNSIDHNLAPELFVSRSYVELDKANSERVYFSSNKKYVIVETTGMTLQTAGVSYAVNTHFDAITTTNFKYTYNATTGKGTGYVDIKRNTTTFPNLDYRRIYLKGYDYSANQNGNLRREITVRALDLVEFAASNIVFKGGVYTFAEDVAAITSRGISERSQGIFFPWGSLIGTTSKVIGSHPDFSAEILWKNQPGYAGRSLSSPLAFIDIPSLANSGISLTTPFSGDDDYMRFLSPKGYDATEGWGDICRYISDPSAHGGVEWVKGKWRTPTRNEIIKYMNSSTKDLSVAGSVGLKSPAYNSTFSGETTSGNPNGLDQLTLGVFIGSGVNTVNDKYVIDKKVVFLPAAGYKNSQELLTGKMLNYLTSSLQHSTSYYSFKYDGWQLPGLNYANTPNGFQMPVRCVRDK